MVETVPLPTRPRDQFGSKNARRLRQQGLIPGVIYGHKEEVVAVVMSREDLDRVIRKAAHIVDVEYNGKTEKARVRELQWDHLGKEVLHVDLMRVSKDERIVIGIPVVLRGHAPGTSEGGVLDQPIHVLNVECPVLEIPEFIRVNIDHLGLGQAIHVKELTLPPGVVAKADPDAVVVHVKAHRVVEEAAAPAEGAAEPEVIKKAPKAGEEEE
ncbi:MAG: 50S ribosomal protein L25 [Gemmataceae bacterium]|nr:50S ribosomal protein L25 [Gemmataceae bacterium]